MAGIDANTLLCLHMDGSDDGTTFTDSSSYNRTATRVSTPVTKTGVKKFGTASGYTATGAEYITFPDAAEWPSGTDAWTIEGWMQVPLTTKDVCFYEQRADATHYMSIYYDGFSSGLFTIMIYNGAGVYTYITATLAVTKDTLYHIAFVRVNSDNAATGWRIFIDGVSKTLTLRHGNWNDSVPAYAGTVAVLSAFGFSGYVSGYLDEVRVSNIARWTSDFTPPTEAYSTDGGFMTTNKGWL
jgi:hypothetical protein